MPYVGAESAINDGTTLQYYRGDKAWATLSQSAIAGLTTTDTPTFAGLIAPTIIGGTETTSDLTLKTTSGVGATGADMHFLVGNNGGTEALTILNNGDVSHLSSKIGFFSATPVAQQTGSIRAALANLGLVTSGTYVRTIAVKTADYVATATDEVIVCNKATAMTITLPAATGSGRWYNIKNINTGSVTIDGNSSDTIDGATTATLGQWEGVMVIDYAANAWIAT